MKIHSLVFAVLLFVILSAWKFPAKNQTNNIEKNEPVIVQTNQITIVIPSATEVDSLKQLWGEAKFYTVADDENASLAEIYNFLEENNISYHISQKNSFYIGSNVIEKTDLAYSWGVLTSDENYNYSFRSTTDFLMEVKENPNSITSENEIEIAAHWYGRYRGSFLRLEGESADPRSQASLSLQIDKNGGVFKLDSYVENVEISFQFSEVDKKTLKLIAAETISGEKLNAQLGTLLLEDGSYYLVSPYISSLLGKTENDGFRVKLKKHLTL